MVNLRLPWLQELWFIIIIIIIIIRVKTMANFGEHGNSEKILDALVVVKLLLTLKHVNNLNTQKSFTGLWM